MVREVGWSKRKAGGVAIVNHSSARYSTIRNPSATAARAALVVLAVLYSALFNYVYITIVAERWTYAGLVFNPITVESILISASLALVPLAWMPIRLSRASQLLHWLLYAVVYVPSIFLPHYLQRQSPSDVIRLDIALCFSMWLVSTCYRFPLRRLPAPHLPPKDWWMLLFVSLFGSYIAILAVFGNRLEFAGLYNEDLRLAARDMSRSFVTNYSQLWAANTLNPMIMALSLFLRRPWLFGFAAVGQIVLFMTAADKIFLLSVGFVPLMFLCVKARADVFGIRFLAMMTLLLLSVVFLGFVNSPAATTVQDLISFRFISNAGFTTGVYSDFFSQNDWTYWSHLKGVSAFITYPYTRPLGTVIGEYLASPENNANGHVWATDGLAAMGLAGVVVAGALIGAVFYLVDCASMKADARVSSLSIAMHGIAISNVSIATTLLGGGLFFHLILLRLMPDYIRSLADTALRTSPAAALMRDGRPLRPRPEPVK